MSASSLSPTESKVTEIIRKVAKLDEDPPVDSDLMMEVGIDSLIALRILASIEKNFDVQIPDDQLQDLTSVRKISNFLDGN